MPYINTKVNMTLEKEKEIRIKERFGKAIALIPGKSEDWLMLSFEDNCSLYFRGDSEKKIAYLEVKIFGSAPDSAHDLLTAELTKILNEELGIEPQQIYIKYEEVEYWGYNGRNF